MCPVRCYSVGWSGTYIVAVFGNKFVVRKATTSLSALDKLITTRDNNNKAGGRAIMYGAIIGDIVGSPFEFDRGDKTKNFELFSDKSRFTDDTVMTIAVGEA